LNPYERLDGTFNGFFDVVVKGGDLEKAEVEHEKVLDSIGANRTYLSEYVYALKALADALDEGRHSQESERCEFNKLVDQYIESVDKNIMAQPGMENFKKSKKLRSNSLNKEFFELYDELVAQTVLVKTNPATAPTLFNSVSSKKYARVVYLLDEISDRAVAAKAFEKN
jgi:hypothetical protein